MLLGTIGLATQAGLWYADNVNLQTYADAASTTGAVGIASGETATQFKASARYVLGQNGLVNGQNGVTITINSPPATGPNSTNSNAVEVIVTKPEGLTLAGLFLRSAPTEWVRSVATYGSTASTCALALGQNLGGGNTGQFTMSGGASLTASGCAVSSNSTDPNAFYIKPSPTVTAYTIVSSGGVTSSCGQGPTGCGSTLTLTKPYSQNHVATADPLAATQNVTLPTPSNFSNTTASCGSNNITFAQWNSTVALTPGSVYCALSEPGTNGITFPNTGGTYTFAGNVSLNGTSAITSAGTAAAATVYVNGSLSLSNYNPSQLPAGTYHITNGLTITSSSATSVAYSSLPSTFYINGNLSISGSAAVDIPPGTYFINNGNLLVGGSGSLTCNSCVAGGAGVTFVLMGSSAGYVDVSGSSPVTFSAPANNNYSSGFNGIAFYEVPTDTSTNKLQGSGSLTFQGAFYAPGAVLDISGAAGTSTATCAVYIANTITISGSGYASSSQCQAYGYGWTTSGPTPNGVTIVE